MLAVKAAFTTTFHCSHRPSAQLILLLRTSCLYHALTSPIYTTLNHARSEIRVIQIKPGQWNDSISCRLKVVSLDRLFKPRYDALSYTWGSSMNPKTITVNQQETAISPNLFMAMRALRRKHRTVTIWADALCINQNDNDEKSKQVALMGRIYKQCRQTWVSLGCPDEGWADGAWSPPSRLSGKLELLKSFVRRMWRAIWHHVVLRRSQASRLGVNHISDSLRLMQSMQSEHNARRSYIQDAKEATSMLTWLATHGYWSRVWIAQEIALSKIDPICLFGKHQVPLLSLDTVFSDWSDGGLLSSIDAQKPSWSPIISQGIARAQEICMLRDEYLSMRQSLRAGHLTGSMDLPRILQLASHRNATVPHDYVYGLRSLLSTKNQESLMPDYNLSIRELYASVTKLLLQNERSVSLLCAAVGTGQDNPHDLPSWTLDCSKPLRLPTRRNDEINAHKTLNAIESESTDVLQLTGTCLDVTITTAVPHDYLSTELGSNETVSEFMQSDIFETSTHMNNAYEDPRPPNSESYHFFMTSHNTLGKCANEVQEEDQLWKLDGATETFVLRALPATGEDESMSLSRDTRYKLVGPCRTLNGGPNGEEGRSRVSSICIV